MKKRVISFLMIFTLLFCFACSKENRTDNVSEIVSNNQEANGISELAKNIVFKTIDPTTYLDYEKGIEEKVYKWIKSDDGKYFTFAYIDENGNPVKSSEAKINVGANNRFKRLYDSNRSCK